MAAFKSLVSKPLSPLVSRSFSCSFSLLSRRSAPVLRLRPLVAIADVRRFSFAPGIRCFSSRPTTSSLNDPSPNWSNRPPKETILLDGCDFEHWLVVMEPPEGNPTRDEIIDSYIKTFAQVIGSEEEARMKIYSVSTKHYFAFGCLVSEELSYKIKALPKVRWVLPDSYLDVKNKDYGAWYAARENFTDSFGLGEMVTDDVLNPCLWEPFIDGKAVPYDPKYHEEWVRNNARANERSRRNDRPRNFDRSRNFERRRENMQNRDFQREMPPMNTQAPNAGPGAPGGGYSGTPNSGAPGGGYSGTPNSGAPGGGYPSSPGSSGPGGAYANTPYTSGPGGAYANTPNTSGPAAPYSGAPNIGGPSGGYSNVPNSGGPSGAYGPAGGFSSGGPSGPSGGYTNMPNSGGYSNMPSTGPSGGYSNVPSTGPSGGYSNVPSTAPSGGYSNVPSTAPSGGYSNVPGGGYSNVPGGGPSSGYSNMPGGGPSGGYSNMPGGGPNSSGYSNVQSGGGYSNMPNSGPGYAPNRDFQPSYVPNRDAGNMSGGDAYQARDLPGRDNQQGICLAETISRSHMVSNRGAALVEVDMRCF
ncbi:hypothetical protein ACLOJK_031548 [Asimina triloba]